ncbi:hypothetical protein T03_6991 [Trichinella britovi]|uniref:Uncharacterized protein n=1 Tax=Trichinella britovi TaxID=45882 RepID=A0A0V1AJI4_TRIBR|nr:hypothetical protein T03_6991 [Trichinella britovi]
MALRNSPALEHHKQQLLGTAPLYAYRHRVAKLFLSSTPYGSP